MSEISKAVVGFSEEIEQARTLVEVDAPAAAEAARTNHDKAQTEIAWAGKAANALRQAGHLSAYDRTVLDSGLQTKTNQLRQIGVVTRSETQLNAADFETRHSAAKYILQAAKTVANAAEGVSEEVRPIRVLAETHGIEVSPNGPPPPPGPRHDGKSALGLGMLRTRRRRVDGRDSGDLHR